MAFIDGENLTIRAQEVLKPFIPRIEKGKPWNERTHWTKDTFIWMPSVHGRQPIDSGRNTLESTAMRAYYYTSITGDDLKVDEIEARLWDLGFTPRVFKRLRGREKSKGIDITLTKDMLSHGFQNHYDIAVLMAGDGDYVPLVEEVKHLGKRVMVVFFGSEHGLSPKLKRTADEYFDMTDFFIGRWA